MDSITADQVVADRLWQGLSQPSRAARPADRYFALMGRPMMQVRGENGHAGLVALDHATGAFLPSHALLNRFLDGLLNADEMDEASFQALVRRWRARTLAECEASLIRWTRTADAEFPYAATRAGQKLALRCGGHLGEPSWTLFAAGEEIGELSVWPAAWNCEEPRVSGARAAWAVSHLAAG